MASRKKRNKVIDYAVYLVLRVFVVLVGMLPWSAAYAMAGGVGNLFYRLNRRYRKRAIGHLRLSFPDWTDDRIEQVARASIRSIAYLGLEFLFTTRRITREKWEKHVSFTGIDEALNLLDNRKSGLIFVTGHWGNWEVLAHSLAIVGYPMCAIARRLDNPYVDEYVLGRRESEGLRVIDKKGASTELDGILDDHGAVAFLADQDAGRKGVFVDFFGRPASTYKSIALMAMRHEAPIIVGHCKRCSAGFSFEISVQKVIYPDQWADEPDPMGWITQQYTSAIEGVVRSDPSQYLWVHRRWKHRPKGQERPADGIA